MSQTALVKFRVTAAEKQSLVDAARVADQSVSAILRRAGRAVIGGRVASRAVLTDLAAVRSIANALAAAATNPAVDQAQLTTFAENSAATLREIAARHLAAVR